MIRDLWLYVILPVLIIHALAKIEERLGDVIRRLEWLYDERK